MRCLVIAAALILVAGCQLPERNNRFDPSRAPSVVVSVVDDGEPVLEGTRRDALQIRFTGTRDPQGDSLEIDVFRFDPRTDEEIAASPSCPTRLPTQSLGTVEWTGTEGLDWVVHGDVCFEPASAGARMRVGLRAVARDPGGYTGTGVASFILRNVAPVVVPPATVWRDTAVALPVTLDAGQSYEVDPGPDGTGSESLTYTWDLVAGPVDVSSLLGETAVPLIEVDFASIAGAYRPGATYRFEVRASDGWDTSAPAPVEVVLSPALWAGAADQLSLADFRWSESNVVLDAGVPVSLPQLTKIAGGPDGIWAFTNFTALCAGNPTSSRCDARYVSKDLSLRTWDLSPGYSFERVLGSDPAGGFAWVRAVNGATYRVLAVTTASAAVVSELDSTEAQDAGFARRLDPDSTLWILGDSRAAAFAPGGAPVETVLDGTCVQNGRAIDATVDIAGNVYLLGSSSGSATIASLTPAGAQTCRNLGEPDSDGPRAILWTPGALGTGELLLGYDGSRGVESLDPATGLRVNGPDIRVDYEAMRWDRVRNRVIASGPEATGVWEVGAYDVPLSISPVSNGLGLDSPGDTFAVDGGGDPWIVLSDVLAPTRIAHLPAELALVRVSHPGESFASATITAVDPATGRIWIVRSNAAVGGLEAVAFDEKGPAPDPGAPVVPGVVTPWTVPLPDGVYDLLFDAGATDREPAFWAFVELPAGGWAMRRVGLDGAVLTSFGAGEQFPATMLASGQPTAPAVEPATGALWVAVNGGSGSGATRFALDGAIGGWSGGFPSGVNLDAAPRPRGTIDASGRYWAFDAYFDKVYWSLPNASKGFFPAGVTELCPMDTGPELWISAIHYDRTANELSVTCREYVPDENASYAAVIVRLRANPVITERQRITFSTSINDDGFLNPTDGTLWLPDGFTVRQYDRALNPRTRSVPVLLRNTATR